jgi:acetoin:2,6-dichlorophenolindophenol oxidoreductase subunit alpha
MIEDRETCASSLSTDELLRAYEVMRLIREFEERVHVEFSRGKIPGFVHLYAGEEAIAAGLCAHLHSDDWIVSTHRGHGHAIAKGSDLAGMMAELFGRSTGLCHGKGGSMHIADLQVGMLGANAIVGGGPPMACGAALTAQLTGSGGVSVSFTGDGGSNQGAFLESLNLGAVWGLPVVFVVENNGYGEATPTAVHQAISAISERAAAFGLPGVTVDGHDFFAVERAAREAIARARNGGGPTLLECKTTRFFGHYEGDSQTYRAKGEVERARESMDCLKMFEERVTSAGMLDAADLRAIDERALRRIELAVQEAEEAPGPTASELLTDVYVSY